MKPRKATKQEIQIIKDTFKTIAQEKPELSDKALKGAIYHTLRRAGSNIERHHVRYVLRKIKN
jgi:hypothetical protein